MYLAAKRLIDLLVSSLLLFLLSPLFLLISLLIRLDSPGSAIFCQERVGLRGRLFTVYKFRTMANRDDEDNHYITDEEDPRITRIGKFLRRFSLDELPQLFNILKGDMTLIGPRPTLLYQVEQYSPRQRKRLAVRPGLTGWAQINGRNQLSWPERIELDIWYVENQSPGLDLMILWRTVSVVLAGSNLYGARDKFLLSRELVILGAGGVGREVQQYIRDINKKVETYRLLGFIQEGPLPKECSLNGSPLLGDFSWFSRGRQSDGTVHLAVCAVGSPQVKLKFTQLLLEHRVEYATLVHPSAVVADTVSTGKGVVIGPGSVITANSRLGDHVFVHYNCTIGHDCVIEDFATILPGANVSGNVKIGTGTTVGANSCILPNTEVGANCTIGAGAVVTVNVAPGTVVAGVPARQLH
ncbi:MAG TPA: NeuD/PglB/VioB family sugar acetyltransferase [Bacillota bacterium]|nr:NeuD/PglB/VioB family sugar acetyltransferase [Bacillota bacterium]